MASTPNEAVASGDADAAAAYPESTAEWLAGLAEELAGAGIVVEVESAQ
jgi:hypothetical protein